jgi:uncharacterized sulfatase
VAPWKFPHLKANKPKEHIEDRMAEEAIAWLKKRDPKKPFFMNYWQFSVHAPFDAKADLIERYTDKIDRKDSQHSPTYAAMVHSLDDAVGSLLDAVDAAGIADNTVFVFFSDNGGNMYNGITETDADGKSFVTVPTSNRPLRGGKGSLYDGGIRVPAVISWPGVTLPGSKSGTRIQSTDLYPTILRMAGGAWPDDHVVDGKDLAPALKGQAFDRGPMITYFPHATQVPHWLPSAVAVHHGNWKLIRLFHHGENGAHDYRLYDLSKDIGEAMDVAPQYGGRVKALDGMIEAHLKDAKAVKPLPNPRFDPAQFDPAAIGVQRGGPKMSKRPHTVAVKPPKPKHTAAAPMPRNPTPPDFSLGKKPNIILIYTDDHGWPDIGAAGVYDDLKTPHLDRMAREGVRATNGYSSAPQCVPSRAGLLSGRFQSRFGVEANKDPLDGFNAQLTIAERLKTAGYATMQAGKWHLGSTGEITKHGFDHVYSKNANRPHNGNFTRDGKDVKMQQIKDKGYHIDDCADASAAFIRRYAGKKPFFLYLAWRAPHVPLDAPKKYLDRFPGKMPERRRQALAMIAAMDDGVGTIMAQLKASGADESTMVFFIGDNGAPLKIHMHDAPGGGPGWDGSLNKPMNGEKGMLAEGGIRVPWLAWYKGTFPAGQVYEHPVSALDVAATAVAAAGLPHDPILDGVDLLPFFSGKKTTPPHEALYWRWVAQSAVREGKWKLLVGGDRSYLYDIAADPGETKNLIAEQPELAKRLRARLQTWSKELKPPGLANGEMSEVWNAYFDFYLEGKPAPPLRAPRK